MVSTVYDDGIAAILDAADASEPASIDVLNPGASTIEAIIDTWDPDRKTPIRLLARSDAFKTVLDDFLVASLAADLESAGALSLRELDDHSSNALVVTDDRVITLIDLGDRVAGLESTAAELVDTIVDTFASSWDHAAPFSHRTPPRSRVQDTLATEIGERARIDFETMLGSVDSARGNGDLDEVAISLLVAARNEELLYDISKWGEDVGIASKATFSRTKSRLEEAGLVSTEKVPIDVGRPRLRLTLGDPRLRDASTDELANVALSLLE